MTRQRQCILEELKATQTHPTAEEICQLVRRRLPKISLGTVYRNLEILASCNLIQKLELTGCQRRFDGNVANHYHARCTSCGCVQDLHLEQIRFDEDLLRAATNFEIFSHRVEFFGLCHNCQRDRKIHQATGL